MKLQTIKHYLGGALMLAALVAAPALLKAGSRANALPSDRLEALNITPEQQTELDAIKADALTQAAAILTEDQLAALEGKTGREQRRAMHSLDLSEDQRAQLQEIRETSRDATADVLSEEQLAQLETMRGQRGQRGQHAGRGNHQRASFPEALNMTPAQQAELDAIQADAQSRVAAILTDDQLAALEGQTGRERMQTMRSLDLSTDQRAELQEIHEDSRTASDEVLTEEQKAQLQEMRSQRGGNRHSR